MQQLLLWWSVLTGVLLVLLVCVCCVQAFVRRVRALLRDQEPVTARRVVPAAVPLERAA